MFTLPRAIFETLSGVTSVTHFSDLYLQWFKTISPKETSMVSMGLTLCLTVSMQIVEKSLGVCSQARVKFESRAKLIRSSQV